jgi:peptide/nickel transport system permease protein
MRLALLWLLLWFGAATFFIGASGEHDLPRTLQPASLLHPFGFDAFGRDMLTTVLRASLISAAFAGAATLASFGIGVFAGTFLGIAPKWFQTPFLRVLEMILAFPYLLFALSWAAIRGPGWETLAFALLVGTLPSLTRLAYARTRELLSEEYVTAAIGMGSGPWRIMLKHLIPATSELCRVKIPNLFAGALIAEATLSFLGIGAPIGKDSWGSLLAQGKDYLIEAPHIAFCTGVPLVLTILSLQVLSGQIFRRKIGSGSLS